MLFISYCYLFGLQVGLLRKIIDVLYVLLLSLCFYAPLFSKFNPQSWIYSCRTHKGRPNRWTTAAILHRKLNMLNLPCKSVQDYPAKLHTSHCAILQHVPCKILQDILRAILHRVGILLKFM